MEICDVDEQAIVKGPRLTALAKAGNSNTLRYGDRRPRESVRDRARGNLNFSEALVSSFLLATWNLNLVYSPRPVDAFPRNYHSQERLVLPEVNCLDRAICAFAFLLVLKRAERKI
ncbi:hypothetical protein P5673_007098 [Acropora cervicornis]|uniref:Uncharacterized protein n=1 Tax=Acropora cervicornis TaxID=6130 RepID=A0AAD9VC76_ACRCE|nr:hypothetical protein P5673_007098 [Acropora cervicornis]